LITQYIPLLAASRQASVDYYLGASISENTRRAYQAELRAVAEWGARIPIAANDLAAYLVDQACVLSPYTLARRLSAISQAHATLGYSNPLTHPLIRRLMAGIWRVHGHCQLGARALSLEEISALLAVMRGLRGIRDRAIVLLGFRAAMRRSELTSLHVEDCRYSEGGVVLHIRRSKTDRRSLGRTIAVPYALNGPCAVRALAEWLRHSDVETGPVFRSIDRTGRINQRLSPQSVSLIVKGYARIVGVETSRLSAHSLRVGFFTTAANAGVSLHSIQRQTGHKSYEMVSRYIRVSDPFSGNANDHFG
jgi:integrase